MNLQQYPDIATDTTQNTHIVYNRTLSVTVTVL